MRSLAIYLTSALHQALTEGKSRGPQERANRCSRDDVLVHERFARLQARDDHCEDVAEQEGEENGSVPDKGRAENFEDDDQTEDKEAHANVFSIAKGEEHIAVAAAKATKGRRQAGST